MAAEIFLSVPLSYLTGSLTCRKILRHGANNYISHPKEVVLRILLPLKIHHSWPDLNAQTLGPMANTITISSPNTVLQKQFNFRFSLRFLVFLVATVYIVILCIVKLCSHAVMFLVKTVHVPKDQLTGTVPGKPVVDEPALNFQ
jgi:hypothetical protein